VGRAEDEEAVEEEFEYETIEELVKELVETSDVADAVDVADDVDVADAVDEMLEEELSTLPTQMAPRTFELLIGVPILLFI